MARILTWCRNLFRRLPIEQELDDELRSYLDLLVAEKVRSGVTLEQAQRLAALEMGKVEQVKEEVRDVRGGAWLDNFGRDLRYAMRALRRRPGFTAVATVTLALGIGATAAIAGLVFALFQATLPFPEATRLVHIFGSLPARKSFYEVSYVDYTYYRDHARSFAGLAAHYTAPLHLSYDNESVAVVGSVVSPNYFETVGAQPLSGRFFGRREGQIPGRDPIAVISYRLWQTRFAGDHAVLGRVIRLNGVPFTIVGIASPALKGVIPGNAEIGLWIPSSMIRVGYRYCDGLAAGCPLFALLGRLHPGARIDEAQAELTTLARQLEAANPQTNRGRGVQVVAARGIAPERQQDNRRIVLLLGAAVTLVLLIVCANLAGLLLARNVARSREIALRLSLGASRQRLVHELLAESLLLGVFGGGLGIGVAALCNRLILSFYAFDDAGGLRFFDLSLNPTILGVAFGVTLLTVLAFGLAPALKASRTNLLGTIKNDGVSPGTTSSRVGDTLVVVQVALSLVLVIGATLLIQSLRHVYQGESFDPSRVVMVRLRPTLIGYDGDRAKAFQLEVQRRLEATPGIISASPAEFPVMWANRGVRAWLPGGGPADSSKAAEFPANHVGPHFFKTLSVRMVSGREFDERDIDGAPSVVIVNEALARRFWPAEGAVGHQLMVNGVASEVVGVVPDLQYRRAAQAAEPFVYRSYWQGKMGDPLATESRTQIRVAGDPQAMLPQIRRVIASVDPDMPVSEDQTLPERLAQEFQPVRVAGTLLAYFGALALFLSAFGLYGILAFRVTQRTREIGVRMALGAGRGRVAWSVLRRGAGLALIGSVIGIAAALASLRLVGGLLYGVPERDLLTFTFAAALTIAVSLAASYLPASRATRLDPLLALRAE